MMKATTLLYGMLVFYTLGKYGKIPRHAMHFVWSFSLGGCFIPSYWPFLKQLPVNKRWIVYHWNIGLTFNSYHFNQASII